MRTIDEILGWGIEHHTLDGYLDATKRQLFEAIIEIMEQCVVYPELDNAIQLDALTTELRKFFNQPEGES